MVYFPYIYHKNKPFMYIGKYTNPMDPMELGLFLPVATIFQGVQAWTLGLAVARLNGRSHVREAKYEAI